MNPIDISQPTRANLGRAGASASSGRIVTQEVAVVTSPNDGDDRSSLSVASVPNGGPVFDRARVDEIRNLVTSGQYVIDAGAIAQGLLAQSRDLQGLP